MNLLPLFMQKCYLKFIKKKSEVSVIILLFTLSNHQNIPILARCVSPHARKEQIPHPWRSNRQIYNGEFFQNEKSQGNGQEKLWN